MKGNEPLILGMAMGTHDLRTRRVKINRSMGMGKINTNGFVNWKILPTG
jgi:hypothetical protein